MPSILKEKSKKRVKQALSRARERHVVSKQALLERARQARESAESVEKTEAEQLVRDAAAEVARDVVSSGSKKTAAAKQVMAELKEDGRSIGLRVSDMRSIIREEIEEALATVALIENEESESDEGYKTPPRRSRRRSPRRSPPRRSSRRTRYREESDSDDEYEDDYVSPRRSRRSRKATPPRRAHRKKRVVEESESEEEVDNGRNVGAVEDAEQYQPNPMEEAMAREAAAQAQFEAMVYGY